MKKITVRVDDYIYDRINLVAKENHTSANKVIGNILKKVVEQPKEISYIEEIYKTLIKLENKLISISKKQKLHFDISSYHFANQGYLSNAEPSEDKCLNEILNKDVNKFNE